MASLGREVRAAVRELSPVRPCSHQHRGEHSQAKRETGQAEVLGVWGFLPSVGCLGAWPPWAPHRDLSLLSCRPSAGRASPPGHLPWELGLY